MSKQSEKKHWRVHTVDSGTPVHFEPIFEVDKELVEQKRLKGEIITNEEVECRYINMTIGKDRYTFNYLDLFMFIYFCSAEELRQKLQQHYERQVEYLPFEVDFKLSEKEKQTGIVTRRIELPIDDIAMAYAKDISVKYLHNKKLWENKR